VVQLDVRKPEQLTTFLQGCDLVVHGGTPFPLEVKDPQAELFEPTVKRSTMCRPYRNGTPQQGDAPGDLAP
jgi:hypothetical protein